MHAAVGTVANRAPLEIIQVPTVDPVENEIQVRVEWTASTPLDLHQSDGGLLVNRDRPQVLGDGTAGTVVKTGQGVTKFQVGDKVCVPSSVDRINAQLYRYSGSPGESRRRNLIRNSA